MKHRVVSFLIVALCFLAVSCGSEVKLPVRNSAEYAEKTVEVKLPLQLKLDCENCDVEIYCWKGQDVKFEYTTSVTGRYTTEELTKKLEHFGIKALSSHRKVIFGSKYTQSSKAEGKIELRVYIPQKTESIELSCKKGKLKIFDDVEGELAIRADILDVDINRFDGKLNCSIKEGNVRLTAGKLSDGSSIETGRGNIHVKAEYEPSGAYSFIAQEGLLDIFLPRDLNVAFTDDFPLEYADAENTYGDYMEKSQSEEMLNREEVSFRLESGIKRILITRF